MIYEKLVLRRLDDETSVNDGVSVDPLDSLRNKCLGLISESSQASE